MHGPVNPFKACWLLGHHVGHNILIAINYWFLTHTKTCVPYWGCVCVDVCVYNLMEYIQNFHSFIIAMFSKCRAYGLEKFFMAGRDMQKTRWGSIWRNRLQTIGKYMKTNIWNLGETFPRTRLRHLFNKYLLNVCCVSSTGETEMNQIKAPIV